MAETKEPIAPKQTIVKCPKCGHSFGIGYAGQKFEVIVKVGEESIIWGWTNHETGGLVLEAAKKVPGASEIILKEVDSKNIVKTLKNRGVSFAFPWKKAQKI